MIQRADFETTRKNFTFPIHPVIYYRPELLHALQYFESFVLAEHVLETSDAPLVVILEPVEACRLEFLSAFVLIRQVWIA